MMLLPTSLLALLVVHISALPIDQITCDPTRLSLILNPSWATSPTIHSYCSALFTPDQSGRPPIPTLEVSSNATPTDLRKACECIVAMPELPIQSTHTVATQHQKQQQALSSQPQKARVQPAAEQQELKVRTGKVSARPYGRGAVPAPVGSELKGFGARDNLYKRGVTMDGARNRGI